MDRKKYSAASLSFNLLSRTCIRVMGIYVLALCVFVVAASSHSWVLLWHIEENKDGGQGMLFDIAVPCVIVWFLMRGDLSTGFFIAISSQHR